MELNILRSVLRWAEGFELKAKRANIFSHGMLPTIAIGTVLPDRSLFWESACILWLRVTRATGSVCYILFGIPLRAEARRGSGPVNALAITFSLYPVPVQRSPAKLHGALPSLWGYTVFFFPVPPDGM